MADTPEYGGMEWRCNCGEAVQESGDREGLKEIKRHQMGQPGHKILGLYDGHSDDAKLLVAGPSPKKAQQMGYLMPPDQIPTKDPPGGESPPKHNTRKTSENRSNVRVGVRVAELYPPESIWAWMSFIRRVATQDDGTPYPDGNEGNAAIIYDCVETKGREALSVAARMSIDDPRLQYIVDLFRGSVKMKQLPVKTRLNVTPSEDTNVEDVIQDAYQAIENDAMARRQRATQPTEVKV